jgi:hypothetical protein
VKGSNGVASIVNKMTENKLKWLGMWWDGEKINAVWVVRILTLKGKDEEEDQKKKKKKMVRCDWEWGQLVCM